MLKFVKIGPQFKQLASGLCVDIDECIERSHSCDTNSEKCENLVGTFRCVEIDCEKLTTSAALECTKNDFVIRFPFCVYSGFAMQKWYLGGPESNAQKPEDAACYSRFDSDAFWFYWRAEEGDSWGQEAF